ncbi:MAG TPA: hypothetical protein VGT24_00060 [Candidatus Acidoferrales bacterium]|nr:hypothetical protein [Candidatus Acidoferrales bacterium]
MQTVTGLTPEKGNFRSRKSVSSRIHHVAGTNQPSPIETAGEIFSGGTNIELIADSENKRLLLLFTEGQTSRVATRIEYRGRAYVPFNLDARTLRGVRFPHKVSDYGSTKSLFTAIQDFAAEYGYAEEIAQLGTYFVFSAWFPDCVPAAPCLLITGPRPEACLFLQLLSCLVRHPLQLVDFNAKSLSSLMAIKPTLLICQEHLSASKLRLLFASTNPDAYVPLEGGLANFYSVMAIYRGIPFHEGSVANTILQMNLTPIRRKLPILDSKTQEEIAGKFQSKLLKYRTRNIDKVRESAFDFPWLTSGARILARILGACIVDAPELQADLAPFFQRQQQAIREQNWLDARCVAIEAGLAYCHSVKRDHRVFVGKFAYDLNTILKGRGHAGSVEPKEIGNILRSFGFFPKRGSKGYALRLTDEVRRRIHRLAFENDIAAVVDAKPRCQHCREIMKNGIRGKSSTPEERE